MRRRRTSLAMSLAFCLGLPSAVQAQTSDGSQLLSALSGCRALADDDARLACYDAAAGRLENAERAGEVVVVDREQARAARRQAFGFSLPSLDMFRRVDGGADLDRVTLTIARASRGGDGKWVFRTEGGQTWRQIDTRRLSRGPRPGSKLEVRRAALGSYMGKVDGQTALRVRREE